MHGHLTLCFFEYVRQNIKGVRDGSREMYTVWQARSRRTQRYQKQKVKTGHSFIEHVFTSTFFSVEPFLNFLRSPKIPPRARAKHSTHKQCREQDLIFKL